MANVKELYGMQTPESIKSIKNNRDTIIRILENNVRRRDASKLIEFLDKSDFFFAPASARYHGSVLGGLAAHTINVYNRLVQLMVDVAGMETEEDLETAAIIAICHDLCKVHFYSWENRRVKVGETWKTIPQFTYRQDIDYLGHGEMSAMIAEHLIPLTIAETTAIRWHMGAYDASSKLNPNDMSAAYKKYPIAFLLHTADSYATFIDEADIPVAEEMTALQLAYEIEGR